MRLAFVLSLGEHWHGETPRWRSPGLGFLLLPPPFFPLSLQLEMCWEQQASLGNGHGDLVEATATWLGMQKDPEHRGRWGSRASAWGLCKNKELKKKKNQRGEATQSRREDRRLWDVVQGPRSGLGGKRDFFLLLMGIVMVLSYFTGGVNIACYPVYLLKISV